MKPQNTIITTGDGRELAVCEWGDRHGTPVFWLHGTPGSRFSRHHDEEVYRAAGARVITYDRPGYGLSTRYPGRSVAHAAGDVASIADGLGLGRFSVTGGSGGGPHALGVAALLPERVIRCASVVGIAPWDADIDWLDGMTMGNVEEFGWALEGEAVLHENMEPRCRRILDSLARGEGLGPDYELASSDRKAAAADEQRLLLLEATTEAFSRGIWGLVDDDIAFTRPWGFDPALIAVPTQVWHGMEDTLVPPQHAKWLIEHIANAEEKRMAGGHLGLVERAAELVRWLIEKDC